MNLIMYTCYRHHLEQVAQFELNMSIWCGDFNILQDFLTILVWYLKSLKTSKRRLLRAKYISVIHYVICNQYMDLGFKILFIDGDDDIDTI